MSIGKKIRDLRKGLGLTQTELGAKLKVKTNAVSKWECGRVEDIPMSKVKAMAVLFNVKPSYLIDDEVEILPVNLVELTDEENELIDLFRLIPEDRRELILQTCHAFADSLK